VSGLPPRQVGVVLRRRGRPSAPARATLELIDEVVASDLDDDLGLHLPGRGAPTPPGP
jgi:hypothetical protein